MKFLRTLSYRLFRLIWNPHLTENPESAIPLAETLRISAIRSIGFEKYEESRLCWAKVCLSKVIRSGGLILIAGSPKHGKTHIAQCISELTGMKFGNTSDLIYEEAIERYGKGFLEKSKEEIRGTLCEIGDSICKDDPAAICKELYSRGVRIIAGLRKLDELREILFHGIPVFVIWVTRPGHDTVVDNTNLSRDYCDFDLVNDELYETRVESLLELSIYP